MADLDATIQRLGVLLAETLHIDVPAPHTDLLASGLLDSLQLVELLLQLEQQFGLRVTLDDLDLDDLRTLERIARVVVEKGDATSGFALPDGDNALPESALRAAEPTLRAPERKPDTRREDAKEASIAGASVVGRA